MSDERGLAILETRGPRSDLALDEDELITRSIAQARASGQGRGKSLLHPPNGWVDEEWYRMVERGMSEADLILREWRDRELRPWLYQAKRGSRGPAPSLSVGEIIEAANHLNQRGLKVSLETVAELLGVADGKTVAKALKYEGLSIVDIREVGRSV